MKLSERTKGLLANALGAIALLLYVLIVAYAKYSQ